jgi:hypothetical protein
MSSPRVALKAYEVGCAVVYQLTQRRIRLSVTYLLLCPLTLQFIGRPHLENVERHAPVPLQVSHNSSLLERLLHQYHLS